MLIDWLIDTVFGIPIHRIHTLQYNPPYAQHNIYIMLHKHTHKEGGIFHRSGAYGAGGREANLGLMSR